MLVVVTFGHFRRRFIVFASWPLRRLLTAVSAFLQVPRPVQPKRRRRDREEGGGGGKGGKGEKGRSWVARGETVESVSPHQHQCAGGIRGEKGGVVCTAVVVEQAPATQPWWWGGGYR